MLQEKSGKVKRICGIIKGHQLLNKLVAVNHEENAEGLVALKNVLCAGFSGSCIRKCNLSFSATAFKMAQLYLCILKRSVAKEYWRFPTDDKNESKQKQINKKL